MLETNLSETDTPMLEVNPDDLCQLIQLARDFHARESLVTPDEPESPVDEMLPGVFSAQSGDPILEEFRSIVADLDRAQQVQVVALMWLGRGDYDPEEWDTVVAEADEHWSDYAADYLLAHPLVADQLSDGMEALGYDCQ